MAWDEWERLKTEAVERQAGGVRLNGTAPDPTPGGGSVTGGLKSSRDVWLAAGADVGALRGDVGTALGRLESGQSGLGPGEGCLSAAAQRELYASWQRYAEDVRARCGRLGGILDQVGQDLLRTDALVEAAFARVSAAHADTDAVGGRPQGG
ncbi:hypothetical protein [Streptomyces yaizuensis]|uniref:Amino acid ABC transporter permease n=1 Tax=Streptomyces yaizuensis TaxID=2989713 RepID=A0ABQ5P4Q5_9ACTN|nr:hypothetical protein [Streptomyces sp. YSPA8]GLF97559.1 amino acid ABC transporter permease [Streptomyces sp. YSPA8]